MNRYYKLLLSLMFSSDVFAAPKNLGPINKETTFNLVSHPIPAMQESLLRYNMLSKIQYTLECQSGEIDINLNYSDVNIVIGQHDEIQSIPTPIANNIDGRATFEIRGANDQCALNVISHYNYYSPNLLTNLVETYQDRILLIGQRIADFEGSSEKGLDWQNLRLLPEKMDQEIQENIDTINAYFDEIASIESQLFETDDFEGLLEEIDVYNSKISVLENKNENLKRSQTSIKNILENELIECEENLDILCDRGMESLISVFKDQRSQEKADLSRLANVIQSEILKYQVISSDISTQLEVLLGTITEANNVTDKSTLMQLPNVERFISAPDRSYFNSKSILGLDYLLCKDGTIEKTFSHLSLVDGSYVELCPQTNLGSLTDYKLENGDIGIQSQLVKISNGYGLYGEILTGSDLKERMDTTGYLQMDEMISSELLRDLDNGFSIRTRSVRKVPGAGLDLCEIDHLAFPWELSSQTTFSSECLLSNEKLIAIDRSYCTEGIWTGSACVKRFRLESVSDQGRCLQSNIESSWLNLNRNILSSCDSNQSGQEIEIINLDNDWLAIKNTNGSCLDGKSDDHTRFNSECHLASNQKWKISFLDFRSLKIKLHTEQGKCLKSKDSSYAKRNVCTGETNQNWILKPIQ